MEKYFVYRNFAKNSSYKIKDMESGKVVAQLSKLPLKQCNLKIKSGSNVAGVEGSIAHDPLEVLKHKLIEIVFDRAKERGFVVKRSKRKVSKADYVVLCDNKIWAVNPK